MADIVNGGGLDVKETSTSNSNPLAKKLNKLLESRLENDKDTIEALRALSTFFNENNLRTRRSLRSDIERRSLGVNEDFRLSFQEVHNSLEGIYQNILAMNECCKDMTSRLKAVKIQTNDLINQTTKLQNESHCLNLREEVVTAFLESYQLKPEEVRALQGSRNNELGPIFFTALARVKKIHNDCKVLLRTSQQTAGLEIMECMALHLETAFERLYRFTQAECRLMTAESLEISPLVCQAMEALQERPILFRYCIDEFGAARRASVVRCFIDALTRGGPGGYPGPMELHSHDPVRYVGDMLAWIHQATASEKEHLEALLKMCFINTVEETTVPFLSHIIESVCRPLRVRVEQVIVSEPGSVTLYQLANLLQFYHITIKQILPVKDSALLTTMEEMRTLAHKMFLNSVHCHMTKLFEKIESPPMDLGPTDALVQTLLLLRDILSCHDSSIVSPDDKQKDFTEILSNVIDPLLQLSVLSASKLSQADMAAFLLNCVYHIQATLALFQYTDQHLEMLQAQMDAHLDTLVSEQVSNVLVQTGFSTVYSAIQQHQPKDGPLSQKPGADNLAIVSAVAKFDTFLSAPDSLIITQHALLQSATLRQQLRKSSMELLCRTYQNIYDSVMEPANCYGEPVHLMPRSADQVQHLLML